MQNAIRTAKVFPTNFVKSGQKPKRKKKKTEGNRITNVNKHQAEKKLRKPFNNS